MLKNSQHEVNFIKENHLKTLQNLNAEIEKKDERIFLLENKIKGIKSELEFLKEKGGLEEILSIGAKTNNNYVTIFI